MKTFIYTGLINCLFWFCFPLSAQNFYTVTSVPNDHLQNAADYVTNPDGIISQTAENTVNERIASIESASTAEIAVVLISSIGDRDIDDFGTSLFTHWGIGKKNDNGLLFLLVYDQKQMIFRTGYGLEGVLPDVILSRVIRNDISPLLRNGDFDGGIIAGIAKVCDYLKNPEAVQEIMQKDKDDAAAKTKNYLLVYLGISLIIAACFFYYLLSKYGSKITNYQKYLSLSKLKGAVIGFTVFFPALMVLYALVHFLLLKRLRTKPIACSQCGNMMVRLDRPALNDYLTQSEKTEESIRSVDYDVWRCEKCGHTEALAFNESSKFTECPYCQAKTFYFANDRIVKQATSFSAGQGERVYACMNCKKTQSQLYDIPRIIVTTSGGFGRGGGFGGGGGSWGGGSTGGGGARGGW